jgi:HD-GYP domain-containing protein (c-di-GMP phosphodiesterase class II)
MSGGLDATANHATRERRQELGLRAVLALHVVLRLSRNYDDGSAVFAAPLAQLGSAIEGLLQTDGSFELRFSAGDARANQQVMRVDPASLSLVASVRDELASRGAAALRADRLPPVLELRALVTFLRSGRRATLLTAADQPFEVLRFAGPDASAGGASREAALEDRLVASYGKVALFAGRTIGQLRTGAEVAPSWAAGHLVRDLVDLQQQAPLAFLSLARAKADGDEYWGHHAANVAVLAISLGARLGLSKRRRHDLGMAAVFHDVGLAATPSAVLGKRAALDERERGSVLANPLFAARVLLRDREVHPAALERALGAFDCHLDLERPEHVEPKEIGFCGRAIALCEAFDALTSARPYRGALAPKAALAAMAGPLAYRYDQRLLRLFTLAVAPLIN